MEYKKRYKKILVLICLVTVLTLALCVSAFASADDDIILDGIYAGDIKLSGMSPAAAQKTVEDYVHKLEDLSIKVDVVGGNTVSLKVSELGMKWANPELIEEAYALGHKRNPISRYKDKKDLAAHDKVFDINLEFDETVIENVIKEKCSIFDEKACDASITRKGGEFIITDGVAGERINTQASALRVKTYMEIFWDRDEYGHTQMITEVYEPEHSAQDLKDVKDVLGTYTTGFTSSGAGRTANVRNGCSLINGKVLYPGQQLSVYNCVSPFTEENGYKLAGSYNKGLVVETLGGGICQVSSTLYNAVLRAELQVDERSNHSMIVSYVDISADAAISGTSKDFKFTNSTAYPIYIQGTTSDDKQITFTIYGKETRDPSRSLSFETEVVQETEPEDPRVIADPTQPVGYITAQSAHTGYSANYYKIVKENGEEKERVRVNSSYYQAVPRIVTFGTKGDVTGMMSAAISTQSVDHCKEVANNLVNAANAAAIQAAQAAAANAAAEAVD